MKFENRISHFCFYTSNCDGVLRRIRILVFFIRGLVSEPYFDFLNLRGLASGCQIDIIKYWGSYVDIRGSCVDMGGSYVAAV